MNPSEAGAGEHGSPDEYDSTAQGVPDPKAEHHSEEDFLDGHTSDPPLPVSPGRRRAASAVAFLLIAIILTFLIWFIASNATRRSTGGMVGWRSEAAGWTATG